MPPTDSSSAGAPACDPDEDDTLDLRLDGLSDVLDLMPLLVAERGRAAGAHAARGTTGPGGSAGPGGPIGPGAAAGEPGADADGSTGALLDGLPGWGPVDTERGSFQLVPVVPVRDLALVTRWMNDPAVAVFWELSGPQETTDRHLRAQLDGDGRSAPCLGVLDGRPMSYWEIYRADLDPLARYYPARPHDTGIHLLIGPVADRGHGMGGTLLRAVADHILDRRPSCTRIVAEPDLRNTASVAAFLTAGFRYSAELELPGKRAALMIRERRLSRYL